MEMGVGMGEEEKGGNCWEASPTSLNRPLSSALSPAGPGWGPDCPAGRQAIPARHRTGIQNTSSAGLPKRAGRPPGGPALGPVLLDWPPKDLKDLTINKKGCDM
jgi:hypothetical protein